MKIENINKIKTALVKLVKEKWINFIVLLYKTKQIFYKYWSVFIFYIYKFVDMWIFCIFTYVILVFIFNLTLNYFSIKIILDDKDIFDLSLAVTSIIGASLAIIFSFSTFILQSTSELFSTQYLNKFIQDKKEEYIYWSLVFLTLFSLLSPHILKSYRTFAITTCLFLAFLLIYILYKELRQRINPEYTLKKIKDDSFIELKRVNKILRKNSYVQNIIHSHEGQMKDLSLSSIYKNNPNWNSLVLENIKYLYEIGLRLLSKNEINSFNLTITYIHDIYLEHLKIRDKNIMRVPADFWGTYAFEDEGFTTSVLEYLESISNRLIQEKRKENIYFLLKVYESFFIKIKDFKYSDNNSGAMNENPILNSFLSYYVGLVEKINKSNERDWTWEAIRSLSAVSNNLLNKDYNHYNYTQIQQALDSCITSYILDKENEVFIKEILVIYFNQIKISWDKYSGNRILLGDIYKNIKKNTLLLSFSKGINLSVSDLYMNFNSWQIEIINGIFDLKDQEKKEEYKNSYMKFIENWSEFLLDLARESGLNDNVIGLPIIQSVQTNLDIIYGIKNNFNIDVKTIYLEQFNILSWYFTKVKSIEDSLLFNLEQIQEILLREINNNLKSKVFETEEVINLYTDLVSQHFEKVNIGSGYNHPRVIEKLVYVGLILTKYNLNTDKLVRLIDELNSKYLLLNKEYFDLKIKEPRLMGCDLYQLCKEIHDLEQDLFSHSSSLNVGLKSFLKQEITKDVWTSFISKINYCKGITYKTTRYF